MELQEVAGKEFLVGLRGYVKEDVRVYLRAVSEELSRREETIADLRGRLEEANQRLEEAKGRPVVDRATLVKLVGEEASAILATADGAAERIRLEADHYARSVREGLVSTRSELAELHQSMGRLLDRIHSMDGEQPDVVLLGPEGNGSTVADEITVGELPERNGEPGWPWGH